MKNLPLLAALSLLIPLCARNASAAPQNLGEYLQESLAKDATVSPARRQAALNAVREKFADYYMDPAKGSKWEAAELVSTVISDYCRKESPERAAAVAFAAYRAVARGADAAFIGGIAIVGCDDALDADVLLSWSNGFAQMRSNRVARNVAAELVFLARNGSWSTKAFDLVKWGLVQGVKDGFPEDKHAAFLFSKLSKDASAPGETVARAHALFAKAKKDGVEPEASDYVFQFGLSRKPARETAAEAAPAPKPVPAPAPTPAPEPKAPVAEAKPLFTEDFGPGYDKTWSPIQVVGGNFAAFAKAGSGALKVVVPAGNSWGKTGLMTKAPLFTVKDEMAAAPLKLEFAFEPEETTGYVIALSAAQIADIWVTQNLWLHYCPTTPAKGTFNFVNTQNGGENYGANEVVGKAPETVTLFLKPASARFETSNGGSKEGTFSWMKTGTPVYAYVFSHPCAESGPAAFTLRSVRLTAP